MKKLVIQSETKISQEDGSIIILEEGDIIQVIEAQSELASPENAQELSSYLSRIFGRRLENHRRKTSCA